MFVPPVAPVVKLTVAFAARGFPAASLTAVVAVTKYGVED